MRSNKRSRSRPRPHLATQQDGGCSHALCLWCGGSCAFSRGSWDGRRHEYGLLVRCLLSHGRCCRIRHAMLCGLRPLREHCVHHGARREGEEGHAVCHTLLDCCSHAPRVLVPERHRHGPARPAREAGESFLAQCRDPGAGRHAQRALFDACRPMAASASGQRVCVPSHHL